MKRSLFKFSLILLACLSLTGCLNMGHRMVKHSRFNYNRAFITSSKEQILLNLVRLRYCEPVLFLDLNSVVSQYELKGVFSANPVLGTDPTYGLEAEIYYIEKPTLTYTPLQGESFIRQLLAPILPETIAFWVYSEWNIKLFFICCVKDINGVVNASEKFWKIADFFLMLQAYDALGISVKDHSSEKNKYKKDKDKKHVYLVFKDHGRQEITVVIDRIKEMLKLDPAKNSFRIAGYGPVSPDTIVINCRSLMGVFNFLAMGIDIPEEQRKSGKVDDFIEVQKVLSEYKNMLRDTFVIHSQKDKPKNAYVKIYYYGYWFYIKDTDLNSKKTFSFLNTLFFIMSAETKGIVPILTLSAG